MRADWEHYFDKVETRINKLFEGSESDSLQSSVTMFCELNSVELSEYDVAIIGVCDARNSNIKKCRYAPDRIREQLYGLADLPKSIKIIDFGNLRGNTLNDKYQLLEDVLFELLKWGVFTVVLGGSQDYTLPAARAIKHFKANYRLAVIDSKVDWIKPEDDFSSSGFLGLLCEEERSCPEDLAVIGCQKYFITPWQLQQIEKYAFDYLRLGEIKQTGLKGVEPWIRDADIISYDANVIRQSDLPLRHEPSPNGFFADEACQLSWYSGVSDQLKLFCFFELATEEEHDDQNYLLGAQIIWHLLEGFSLRCNDYPVKKIHDYRQYIVHHEDCELDIKFYNNPENDRWWVEVPGKERNVIIACDRSDFESATGKEIPGKWFRFLRKNEL